ncbi:MAG: helix-turn-helix domain-containing protein [bacterium]
MREEIKNIKKARLEKGITQKELGSLLGYSESQISHIENRNRKLKLEDLRKAERVLKVKLNNDDVGEKIDKLYEVIKFLFGSPDNYEELDNIYYKKRT